MIVSLVLAACIIAWATTADSSSTPMSPEEAQAIHRVIKQRDLEGNNVHSVVNYDTIKQRYQDYKDM